MARDGVAEFNTVVYGKPVLLGTVYVQRVCVWIPNQPVLSFLDETSELIDVLCPHLTQIIRLLAGDVASGCMYSEREAARAARAPAISASDAIVFCIVTKHGTRFHTVSAVELPPDVAASVVCRDFCDRLFASDRVGPSRLLQTAAVYHEPFLYVAKGKDRAVCSTEVHARLLWAGVGQPPSE